MKKTFLGHENSLLCCMIQAENPTDALSTIAKALPDSDAFGFQQEQLNPIYRTDEILTGIFDAMGDKPAYVTNYRGGFNKGMTDEELGEGLISLVHQGGTLCDVVGESVRPRPHGADRGSRGNRQTEAPDRADP